MVKSIFLLIFNFIVYFQAFSQNCDSIIFNEIENLPEFGGDLNKFILDSICYPQQAWVDNISGTVYITFMVNEDGNTSDHKVVRGIRKDLDDEAIRVARLIKFEKPAMNAGKPEKYKYLLPVEFRIKENKKTSNKNYRHKR